MAYILIQGCNITKNLQEMAITVKLQFKPDYHHSVKSTKMIEQIEAELNQVMDKYFEPNEIETENMSNHEYNKATKI